MNIDRHTDLARHIAATPMSDVHEHILREEQYLETNPDLLQELLQNYLEHDLIAAGATPEALGRARDRNDPDVAARWEGIRPAWEAVQYTGYGEGVRRMLRIVFGIEEITGAALAEANERFVNGERRGERLRLLRDVANLDHVQVDHPWYVDLPDPSGPEFFLYDLSWFPYAHAAVDAQALHQATGENVTDLAGYRRALEALVDKHGRHAIAIKSQHAYVRTLAWQPRHDADAERVLQKVLRGENIDLAEALCLGDWSLARAAELAHRHNLPLKLHTGYHAGNNGMEIDMVRPGLLCPLLRAYPDTRFDLFHIGWPYESEIIALAKHYSNVSLNMCWAWQMDPFAAGHFLRSALHAVPTGKIMVFGGDNHLPLCSVGYAEMTRDWLTRTLNAEIAEGFLSEARAIDLATKLMRDNAYGIFDIEGRRAAINEALAARA